MNNDGPQPPRKQRRRSTAQEVLSKRRNEQYPTLKARYLVDYLCVHI